MTDPVLDAHRLAEFYYLISGSSPISIRDQILRGVNLVERLCEATEIDGGRPLLVVGAGAGGAAAAIEAASRGIPTVLVESRPDPFTTQRHATQRWIDPTQYDWPLDHHHHAILPWSLRHRPLPLGFRADFAPALASRWHVELNAAKARCGSLLDIRYNLALAGVRKISVTAGNFPSSLGVDFDDGSSAVVGAIILATGFGIEKCRFEKPPGNLVYEGQPFWGPDNFANLTPGIDRVLISGSGDGALQDYLRIVSKLRSAAAIAARCNIPASVLQAVQSAEDRSLRARSWASEDRSFREGHEAPHFGELEAVHRDMIDRSLRHPLVQLGLNALMPSQPVRVTLAYRDRYISCYYGLNRFLCLLLDTYILRRFGYSSLAARTEIDAIAPSVANSHVCLSGTPPRANGVCSTSGILLTHACFRQDHDVTLISPQGSSSDTYNVIVIRYGPVPPSLPQPPASSGAPAGGQILPVELSRPRHLPPYHKL